MNSKENFGDPAKMADVAAGGFASYRWLAWLVLALSLSLNLLGWNGMVADLRSQSEERFDLTVSEFHRAMNGRLVGYTHAVKSMQAYVSATDRTPDLARPKETMRVAKDYPGVAWIAFLGVPAHGSEPHTTAGLSDGILDQTGSVRTGQTCHGPTRIDRRRRVCFCSPRCRFHSSSWPPAWVPATAG